MNNKILVLAGPTAVGKTALSIELAKKLNDLNKERQELTQSGLEEAIRIIEENDMTKDKVLVIYLEDVHESIAGIIAGRIRERYNLPTIILTKAHEVAKGSGRSIEEYNMFEELLKCKELLGKFGGHPMAAGMSIPIENINTWISVQLKLLLKKWME